MHTKLRTRESCFLFGTIIFLLLSVTLNAQTPAITSFSPTVVTQRTTVTITGTNFTGITAVKFGSTNAASYTVVSSTTITAVVGAGSTGTVSVTNASGTGNGGTATYIAPITTPAGAGATRVISDYGGYWSSTAISAVAANQPDTQHNLSAFTFGGTIYSTGANDGILSSLTFTPGDYRALPLTNVNGTTSSSASSNYLSMATLIDGNATAGVYTAPGVAGLTVKDVLTDGIKGLGLGTGVTNVHPSFMVQFPVSTVVESQIADAQPDIVVTQTAAPTSVIDIYAFVDASGNIIGSPMQVNFSSVSAIGTWKVDLFTLPPNTSYNTAIASGNGAANGTRDIRLVGYKLSDFGITAANAANVAAFQIMPGGDSDPSFIAYNANAFFVPTPVITTHPVSQVVCPDTSQSVTFTVVATGSGLSYQWQKDGVNIPGATGTSYTISNVTTADAGTYTVVVSNSSGSVTSSFAFLNALTVTSPSPVTVCQNQTATLTAVGYGMNVSYQWYSNTVNSNTGGTLISGATSSTYTASTSVSGTRYYYAVVTADNLSCTAVATSAASVTVNPSSVAGTVSANQVVCYNSPATVSVTGSAGSIQWQQSSNGTSGWTNVTGGTGAQTATYTSPNLTAVRYFRAVVINGSCSTAYSAVTMVGFETTTWNGSAWDNGVPTLSKAIVFTGNYTASADLYGCSLTVNNDAVVNIPSGFNVHLYGAISVNSGSFTLESNANLLQQTAAVNSGNIIVKRSTIPLKRLDYVLWSAPVSGQNLFNFSPNTLSNRFYTYNTNTELYQTIASPSTTVMQTGTGYLVRMPNNHPETATAWMGSFTGVPHNGTYNVAVAAGHYNGIGNPYPSTISADAFMTANSISGALYFWRKTNDDTQTSYATYTFAGGTGTTANETGDPNIMVPNGIIQVGQGFLFSSAAASVSFTNALRVANNGNQFFRSTSADRSRIWLNLTNTDGVFSQALVAYMDGATSGVDAQIDGLYINDSNVALTSLIDGVEYAIQGRAMPFSTSDAVPLGFKVTIAGNYTIAIDHTDGLFADVSQPVYLKDNLLGTLTDLQQGSYNFASASGEFSSRFELHYQTALGVPDQDTANAVVYVQGDDVVINTGLRQMKKVAIYDIRGRLLIERTDINASDVRIPAQVANEPLLVKIQLQDGTSISKKIVK